jgi:hypothetical protein
MVTVGRKNHYGSRSKRGTEVAALFYSLIGSTKLCGVEPKTYLPRAALANSGTVTPSAYEENPFQPPVSLKCRKTNISPKWRIGEVLNSALGSTNAGMSDLSPWVQASSCA